jgi:hypothetical protein
MLKAGAEEFKDPDSIEFKQFLASAKTIFKQVIPSQLEKKSSLKEQTLVKLVIKIIS